MLDVSEPISVRAEMTLAWGWNKWVQFVRSKICGMEALPVGLTTHTHRHHRPKHKTQNSWLYRSQISLSQATNGWLTLALFILGMHLCLSMFGYAVLSCKCALKSFIAGLWALRDGTRMSVDGWKLIKVKVWERMRKGGCPVCNGSTVTVGIPPSKLHLDGITKTTAHFSLRSSVIFVANPKWSTTNNQPDQDGLQGQNQV